MRFGFPKRGIAMVVALATMVLAGAAHGQETTTTETKSFEILSVDGNVLVIREATGTRELTVPSDFRFNVDGRSLAVTDLKPGMKGTARVTKTTISRPVYVTEVRNAKVIKTLGGGDVIVQGPDGFKMYSQGDVDERQITVLMDGKPVRTVDLREGDVLTASIITEGPPQTMSKTEVDVTLAQAAASSPAGSTPSPTADPATQMPGADTMGMVPVDTMAAPVVDTSGASNAAPASLPSYLLWLLLAGVILIALIVVRRARR
jgi:hypothetical protein